MASKRQTVRHSAQPMQVCLSIRADPSAMVIAWAGHQLSAGAAAGAFFLFHRRLGGGVLVQFAAAAGAAHAHVFQGRAEARRPCGR